MPNIDFPSGIRVTSQLPLDPKQYFKTIEDLINLGTNNVNAFTYYDGLIAICNENKTKYIWREQSNYELGMITAGYTYPANTIIEGIDYSGRTFNFFEYSAITSTTYTGGVVSYTGEDLDFIVSPIILYYLGVAYSIPSTLITLNEGDSTHNRIDLFVLNLDTQTVTRITGDASVNPLRPYYNPETQILLSFVVVGAGETTYTENILIYDENVGVAGGEFDAHTAANSSLIGLDLTADPNTNSTHISYKYSGTDTYFIEFDADALVDASNITQLSLAIKLHGVLSAGVQFQIYLTSAGDTIISNVVNLFEEASLDYTNFDDYQIVNIPFDLFNVGNFNKLVFRVADLGTALFIDTIQLSSGIPNLGGNNTWTGLDDTFDDTLVNKEGYRPIVRNGKLKLEKSYWIEKDEYQFRKMGTNTDETQIEDGDKVRFKECTKNSLNYLVISGIFDASADSGNINSPDSYTNSHIILT